MPPCPSLSNRSGFAAQSRTIPMMRPEIAMTEFHFPDIAALIGGLAAFWLLGLYARLCGQI